MTKKEHIIRELVAILQKRFKHEGSGHDWYHLARVWRAARFLAQRENADVFIVELAALLHDIADSKFHNGDPEIGPRKAKLILNKLGVDKLTIEKVAYIVGNVSFSKSLRQQNMKTLEGKVVQDADRIDSIGAISIARTFVYGGFRHRPIFNPRVKPFKHMSIAEAHRGASSLHHFYEKILYVKDLLNTKTAERIARGRHVFTVAYLKQFFIEWDGKDIR
jgi:uncharacterized protein